MKFIEVFLRPLLVVFWLTFVLTGCISKPIQTIADQNFELFAQQVWDYKLSINPEMATLVGVKDYNDQWKDYSPAAFSLYQQKIKKFQAHLQAIDVASLSQENQLNWKLLKYSIDMQVKGFQFPNEYLVFDKLSNWITGLPETLRRTPSQSKDDMHNILIRMERVPLVIEQIQNVLKAGLEKGITPAQVTLQPVLKQLEVVIRKGEQNPFMQVFMDIPEASRPDFYTEYKRRAQIIVDQFIVPKAKDFKRFFVSEYLPHARTTIAWSDLKDGKKWYDYWIEHHTTTQMSAEEIHQLGLEEVKRIRALMTKVMKEVNFKGDLRKFNDYLRKSPKFYFNKAEDLLEAYRDTAKRADAQLPKLFGKLPRNSYGVRAIPDYMEEGAPTAYYFPGNLSAGEAGYFYANTSNLKARPKYEIEALTLHEAVPGHHLQITLAQELKEVPTFRKYYSSTAFSEGWGLYAESLGEEMGFYQDPYAKYGQLTYEIWRAIRLVVDTGIHVKGWTREKAIQYFLSHSGKSSHDIISEVDRYISWPGQALAYKIGELKIQSLRKYAKQTLGESFSLRKYHDFVLAHGSLPLEVLEELTHVWVQQELSVSRSRTN